MHPITVAAALLNFLLVITLRPLPAAAARPPVLDTHGNLVHSGAKYLIVPVTHHGGGLILAGAPTNHTQQQHSSCSRQSDVVQDKNPNAQGLPVTFSPTSAGEKHRPTIIMGGMNLNIQFEACGTLTRWNVVGRNHQDQEGFVRAGVKKEDAIRATSFKILRVKRKQGQGKAPVLFRIVFCSSTCKGCHVPCKDVGIAADGKTRARKLGLTDHDDEPLLVQFKKV